MKRWCARILAVIKHLSFKVFLLTSSIERWQTKTKEKPFAHEGRLTLLDILELLTLQDKANLTKNFNISRGKYGGFKELFALHCLAMTTDIADLKKMQTKEVFSVSNDSSTSLSKTWIWIGFHLILLMRHIYTDFTLKLGSSRKTPRLRASSHGTSLRQSPKPFHLARKLRKTENDQTSPVEGRPMLNKY